MTLSTRRPRTELHRSPLVSIHWQTPIDHNVRHSQRHGSALCALWLADCDGCQYRNRAGKDQRLRSLPGSGLSKQFQYSCLCVDLRLHGALQQRRLVSLLRTRAGHSEPRLLPRRRRQRLLSRLGGFTNRRERPIFSFTARLFTQPTQPATTVPFRSARRLQRTVTAPSTLVLKQTAHRAG